MIGERMNPANWVPVESSVFTSAAYDEAQRQLYLRFQSGEIYRYFEFPRFQWDEFLAAESKGRYFAENIRSNFRYEQIRAA